VKHCILLPADAEGDVGPVLLFSIVLHWVLGFFAFTVALRLLSVPDIRMMMISHLHVSLAQRLRPKAW
jgi:hypothetical protein